MILRGGHNLTTGGGSMHGVAKAGTVVRMKDGRTRQYRSIEERRRIVEETLKPGASVSLVARAHDVNANQVFKWRRQYRKGQLDVNPTSGALLPVRIAEVADQVAMVPRRNSTAKTRKSGIIDIDLGHARV